MSHWHHRMVDGTEFWISCQWLSLLRIATHWQLIQNLAPSAIMFVNVTSEFMRQIQIFMKFNYFWQSKNKSPVSPQKSRQQSLGKMSFWACCWCTAQHFQKADFRCIEHLTCQANYSYLPITISTFMVLKMFQPWFLRLSSMNP